MLNQNSKLIVATHNAGKLREFKELFAPYGIEVMSAGDLNLPEPEETGTDFISNAQIKAIAAARASGLPALADDSGLSIDELGGEPGIYSARWAKEAPIPPQDILDELPPEMITRLTQTGYLNVLCWIEAELRKRGALAYERRGAHFTCAIALVMPDGRELIAEGKVRGSLVWPPRGMTGFGYDPMFMPHGHDRTFGQMSPEEKHGIPPDGMPGLSHRARAFQVFAENCLEKSI